jgi:anti-sigma factor RsiW
MAMSEHDEIRELLGLAASGALERDEEERVARHIRSCALCSEELEDWRRIATGLKRLPTPQAPRGLVERARARAEARLAEEAERRWNRGVMIFVIVFAWVITLLSWPLFHLVTYGFLSLVDPGLNKSWIGFAALMTLAWVGGGAAAILLSLHQRRERSMA